MVAVTILVRATFNGMCLRIRRMAMRPLPLRDARKRREAVAARNRTAATTNAVGPKPNTELAAAEMPEALAA